MYYIYYKHLHKTLQQVCSHFLSVGVINNCAVGQKIK